MANESKYIEPSEEPTIDTEKLFKGHETQILKAREKLLEIKTWAVSYTHLTLPTILLV